MVSIWLLIFIVTLIYLWLKRSYSFWKRNGVPGPRPHFLIGNVGSILSIRKHWGILYADWYKKYVNEPYIGFYKLTRPAILVRDIDLIKKILIDDFDNFSVNEWKVSEKSEPLLASNPFLCRDDEWIISRNTFSPVFSPNKIRGIVPVMNSVGEELINFVKSHPVNAEFDARKLLNRFTTQCVIKTAFSLEAGCFDANQESEFMEVSQKMFELNFWTNLKCMSCLFLPKWMLDIFPAQMASEEAENLFQRTVDTSIESRPPNFQTDDFLQKFLQLRDRFNFPNSSVASHMLSFFMDGAETANLILSYVFYELAVNPRCQQKLHDDIFELVNLYDEQFTYEALEDMVYLDAILYEAMRIHPTVTVMPKECTKKYEMPRNAHQTKPLIIYPGTVVNIPVYAIHMDPQYYPEPEEFRPERFFPEEQRRRHKGTFLAFSMGPRICPAIEFSMTELKVAIVHVIKHFHIELSPNQKGIEIAPRVMLAYPKNDILLKFRPRNE